MSSERRAIVVLGAIVAGLAFAREQIGASFPLPPTVVGGVVLTIVAVQVTLLIRSSSRSGCRPGRRRFGA
jgi:hypothetical protein